MSITSILIPAANYVLLLYQVRHTEEILFVIKKVIGKHDGIMKLRVLLKKNHNCSKEFSVVVLRFFLSLI